MRRRYVPLGIVLAGIVVGMLAGELADSVLPGIAEADPALRMVFALVIAVFVGIELYRVAGSLRQRGGPADRLELLWVLLPLLFVLLLASYAIQVVIGPSQILGSIWGNL